MTYASVVTVIVLLLACLPTTVLATASSPARICIIGAGIASASTAHFLTHTSTPLQITVFEKTHRPAGRVRSLRLSDTPAYEAGASIIASSNRFMQYFVNILNLTGKTKPDTQMGLWNGSHFIFRTSASTPTTLLALFRRYGLSPLVMRRLVRRLLSQYDKLYPTRFHLSHLHPFASVQDLLIRAPDLFPMSQISLHKLALQHFSPPFIFEMVSAIVRVNYGQDVARMNGLSGAVGMAGSGAELWGVEGGNERVIEGLLTQSKVDLRLNTTVRVVRRVDSSGSRGRYVLSTTTSHTAPDNPADTPPAGPHDESAETVCDAVVLAAPYELSGLDVPSHMHKRMDVGRQFQRTVATFVRGTVNQSLFGDNPPGTILTVDGVDNEGFTSMGCATANASASNSVWKIFSRETIPHDVLSKLFGTDVQVLASFPWLAYPQFSPPERFADFDVDNGGAFFYTAPIESAGSAMEMSALAGANAAALVRERLGLNVDANVANKDEL